MPCIICIGWLCCCGQRVTYPVFFSLLSYLLSQPGIHRSNGANGHGKLKFCCPSQLSQSEIDQLKWCKCWSQLYNVLFCSHCKCRFTCCVHFCNRIYAHNVLLFRQSCDRRKISFDCNCFSCGYNCTCIHDFNIMYLLLTEISCICSPSLFLTIGIHYYGAPIYLPACSRILCNRILFCSKDIFTIILAACTRHSPYKTSADML